MFKSQKRKNIYSFIEFITDFTAENEPTSNCDVAAYQKMRLGAISLHKRRDMWKGIIVMKESSSWYQEISNKILECKTAQQDIFWLLKN